jgi:hypothetical protein
MAELTREEILARKIGNTVGIVELADGATVKVRGITRAEAAKIREHDQAHPDDVLGQEAIGISAGMISPELTVAEALQWCQNEGSGNVGRVMAAIQQLSGEGPGQAKEYLKSVPGRRRARG